MNKRALHQTTHARESAKRQHSRPQSVYGNERPTGLREIEGESPVYFKECDQVNRGSISLIEEKCIGDAEYHIFMIRNRN